MCLTKVRAFFVVAALIAVHLLLIVVDAKELSRSEDYEVEPRETDLQDYNKYDQGLDSSVENQLHSYGSQFNDFTGCSPYCYQEHVKSYQAEDLDRSKAYQSSEDQDRSSPYQAETNQDRFKSYEVEEEQSGRSKSYEAAEVDQDRSRSYQAEEDRDLNLNKDQYGPSGVKNARIIATWDQSPVGVHEEFTSMEKYPAPLPNFDKNLRDLSGERMKSQQIHPGKLSLKQEKASKLAVVAPEKLAMQRLYSSGGAGGRKSELKDPGSHAFNQLNKGLQKSAKYSSNKKEARAAKLKRELNFDEIISNLIDNWVSPTKYLEESGYVKTEGPPANKTQDLVVEHKVEEKQKDGVRLGEGSSTPPSAEPVSSTEVPSSTTPDLQTTTEPPKTTENPTFIQKVKNALKKIFSSKSDNSKPSAEYAEDDPDLYEGLFRTSDQLNPVALSDAASNSFNSAESSAVSEERVEDESLAAAELAEPKSPSEDESIAEDKTIAAALERALKAQVDGDAALDSAKASASFGESLAPNQGESSPISASDIQLEAGLTRQSSESDSSTVKVANSTATDALKNFSESELQFLKHLISCMKKSSSDQGTHEVENQLKSMKNHSNVLGSALSPTLSPVANHTLTRSNSTVKPHPANVTAEVNKGNHSLPVTNFTQFVVECEPIVGNSLKAGDEQLMSFNCTKKVAVNSTSKFERNAKLKSPEISPAMLNKLKYLAHVHHAPDEVGKQPAKVVDLKAIEEQINSVKYGDLFNDDNDTLNDQPSGSNAKEPVAAASAETSHDKAADAKETVKRSATEDDPFAMGDEQVASQDTYADYDQIISHNDAKKERMTHKQHVDQAKIAPTGDHSQKAAAAQNSPKLEEMDIHKFSQNLDEPPLSFQFNVDKYVAEQQTKLQQKSLFKPVEANEAPRKYFEFQNTGEEEAPQVVQSQIANQDNEEEAAEAMQSQIANQDDEDDPNQTHEEEESKAKKRDVNSKFEAYRDMVRDQSSAPVVSYDVDSFHANSYRKQLDKVRKENKDKDKFVDNYYFLGNDAANKDETNAELMEKEEQSKAQNTIPNPIDLDIDLKLDKEFQDLQYERDKILHRGAMRDDGSQGRKEDYFRLDEFSDVR